MKARGSTPEHKLTHTGPETRWISAECPAWAAYQTSPGPSLVGSAEHTQGTQQN